MRWTRLDRWPEKVRLMQRNWIGRSEGLLVRFAIDPASTAALSGEAGAERAGNLHHAARHAVRREIHGGRARSSAWPPPRRATIPGSPPSSRSADASAPRSRRSRRRKRRATTRACGSSIRSMPSWTLPVYVANFVLMDYGTGAIFGCPAHDQRDLDFVNAYGLGVTPVVCPPGVDPSTFTVDKVAYDGDGMMINSRFLDGLTTAAAKEEVARRLEAQTLGNRPQGQPAGQLQTARLGHFAPALLGLPDPGHSLRSLRRRAGARGGIAGAAARRRDLRSRRAIRWTAIRPGSTSPVRNAAAPARRETDTMDTFVDSSWYFARFTDPWNKQRADDAGDRQCLAAGRSIYRRRRACDPASALFALLFPRDEQMRPSRSRRAVRRHVHARHGGPRDLSRPRGTLGSRRPRCASRRTRPDVAHSRSTAARRSRSARSRKCRSRSATPSIPTRSSRATAPTPRAGSCCRIRRPIAT